MALLKQQRLAQKIADNSGRPAFQQRSFHQLAKEAGYSASAAANPKRVLGAKSWQEYMQEILPDEQIIMKLRHNALQDKNIHGSNKALDIIFRMKGMYAPVKTEQVVPEHNMTEKELSISILEKEIVIEQHRGHTKLVQLLKDTLAEVQRLG